jgi:hypothetical protein
MVWPTITPLPTAPRRGDAPATFSTNANAWVASLGTFTTEANAAGAYIDQAVLDADADRVAAEAAKVDAENAEAGATSAANYKGEWSSLTGPLAIPASVAHSGAVWMLVDSLADVTASEPTLVNTDWIALTQPISASSSALISEFTLEGDSANVGDLVGLYSNGKVKVIKNHPGELAQNAVTSTFVNAISLSSTLGISVYRDESDGNKVKAQLYSIAGRKLTNVGTPETIANTSATYIHADKIDANNIIIVYQDTSDSSQGKAVVVNIAANVLTIGTPVPFNAAVTTYCKVAVLTTTKAVIVYRDEGNSNYGVANTVAISGLVLTPATEVNFKTAAVLYLDVCRLSDTSAVVSFLGTSSYPEAVALTINPGIVPGTPFVLKSAATTNTTISRLTDTTFVAAYESGSLLYARLGTNSAGTITAGTELPIQANPSFLESCQLTATRVIVTGRNATVSNYGYYWVIDNTTGTTIVNSSSAAFNSGTTSYTFPSKILDNRVLIGYQDSTNYATSYVLDLSAETLQKIAGIAKEAGVESNVIDVVTAGEVDFLSGLVAGSYYYSSATGALSASIGDYEVGVAKSATNLKMNGVIPKVDEEKIEFIERLIANNLTPSIEQARLYDFWKTREVKTSSGTFTVPSNVYAIGIFCLGAGSSGNAGGGGGLSMKIKRVTPGQTIPYTISSGVSACDGMTANAASGNTGGTAAGGMFNYSGGNSNSNRGGAGCGGNNIGTECRGGGPMRHWGQTSAPTVNYSRGGLGMMHTDAVESSRWSNTDPLFGGGGFGSVGITSSSDRHLAGGIGRPPIQLGIFVTSDLTQNNSPVPNAISQTPVAIVAGDWNGGNYATAGFKCAGGLGGGGSSMGTNSSGGVAGAGGLGGGGGYCDGVATSIGGAGGLGGGGGFGAQNGGAGGYGGGGGFGNNVAGAGGSAVVIFNY